MGASPNSASHESRQSYRFAVDGAALEVSWLDKSRKMRTTRARVVNISERGMALEFPEEVMPLMVRFESARLKVKGAGMVRYCQRVGKKYLVGVEFTEGLRWRAPQEQVQEPIPICDPKPAAASPRKSAPVLDEPPAPAVRDRKRMSFEEWMDILHAEYSQPPKPRA